MFNFGKREENNECNIMTMFLVNELKHLKTISAAFFAEPRRLHAKVARMTPDLTDLYKLFINCREPP